MERPDEGPGAAGTRIVVEGLAERDAHAEEYDRRRAESEPKRGSGAAPAARRVRDHGS